MKKGSLQQSEKKPGQLIGRKIVNLLDSIVDFTMLSLFLLMLVFGCYAMWDSRQVSQHAATVTYEIYKPQEEVKGFEDFQNLNPEVLGWITVYGTNIDYPLLQAEDNEKYVNIDPEGNYSVSGSIFLDCRNQKDFSDFNSIIHGHHMAGGVMFGEIENFEEQSYFEEHPYGEIYYGGEDHGVIFFAYLEADAYDQSIYDLTEKGKDEAEAYLELILESALHSRQAAVSGEDHLILLSTCSSRTTNGRDILVGKITENIWENPFEGE